MRLKLSLFFIFTCIYSWSQTTNTFTTSGSFTVPAGLTLLTAECWGAGGAGAGTNTSNSAGGGGGGGYSVASISVVPNSSISYVVGAGGTGGNNAGPNGTASSFSSVSANGGAGGGAGGAGGVGGVGTSFSGGKGANGSLVLGLIYSGGGGGSAGTASNGNSPSGSAGGAAVAGGAAGGAGATLAGAGSNGGVPGGGGGGGLVLLGIGTNKGGNGGNGQIKITYTCPTYNITSTAAPDVCTSIGTSLVTLSSSVTTQLPVGNYVVTYNTSSPSATGLTANMTVSTAGTGTFTAAGLVTAGPSTITITMIASGTCSSTISANNTVTVTVSPPSVGGTVNGGTTICSGNPSALLTLSGHTGSVVKWQYAISPFSSWTDIVNTATTYTSGALTATTEFRAIVQSGVCSTATSAVTTVTVNPLPTITLSTTAASVCLNAGAQNTTLTYSATTGTPTTYSIVWNASPTNSFAAVTNASLPASPITIAVPAGTAAGTYTGTLTVKNANGCISTGSVFTVTVNSLPTITLSGTAASVCLNAGAQNTTLAYSATTGTPTTYSIVWNASPTNTFAAVTNASLPASPITIAVPAGTVAGTYTGTLTVTNANGCISSGSSFTVTVNPLPTITLSATAASVCLNAGAQNTTLAYSATTGTPTTYSIVWNASPTNSFAVVTNASLPASPITVAVPAGTAVGTYTGTLTVANANGCISTGSVFTVTVNPLPTITLSATAASICLNASAQNTTLAYSATTGTPTTYSIVWNASPTNTFAAVTNASLPASPITIAVPAGIAAGTYTGTLTVTNANGCISSGSSFTVTVNPLPTITLSGTAASVCLNAGAQNTTLAYSATTGTPTTYSIVWNASPTNSFAAVTNASLPASPITIAIPAGTAAGAYTGTLTVANANGCISSGSSFTVTVNPLPSITTTGTVLSVCTSTGSQNAILAYTATTGTPTTYSIVWNASPTNTFAVVTNASLPASPITIAVPAGTAAGTYTGTLTVTNANGCISSGSSFTVTVNPLPTITLSGTAASVCLNAGAQNTTLAYSATTGTPTTYSIVWSASPTNSFAAVTSASLPASPITISVPAGTAAGTYTGTLTVTNANGCISSGSSFTVTVNPLPTITLSGTAASVCLNAGAQNTTLAYSATTGTPTTYSIVWNASPTNSFAAVTNASLPASPITIAIPAGTAAGTYTGTLTVANANGCISSGSSFTVTVNPLPSITATGTVLSVCTSTGSQNATLAYTATGGSPTGYSIDWDATANANSLADQLNTSFAFSPTGGNINTIVVSANALAGSYSGIMTITDGNCTVTQAVSITINSTPTPPVIGLITPPTCTIPFGSVALSGLPSGNWIIITNPVTVTTSGSGSSTVITNLMPNTYTFIVSNSATSCTSSASSAAIVSSLVTNYWTGSGWTNSTPNINQNIVFAGDYTSLAGTAGDVSGCSCQVNSGIKVTFESGATLSIIKAVNVSTNSGTSLTFNNNASLVQTLNVSNTGNIVYNRTSTAMNWLDYTYWSSPVSGQKFNILSPNSDPKRLFSYNNAWVAEAATNSMIVGRGYLIRVPNAGAWPNGERVNYPYPQPVSFIGTPNNGNITGQAITVQDAAYFIGNPYPSAIDADIFLTANNLILEGTLYFWTHNTPIAYNGASAKVYNANDYAVYNFTGGTATSAALNPGVNNSVPLGKVAAGQSFFAISIASSGNIVFNNDMRVAGNNAQFFKLTKEGKVDFVEKKRIWLNLTNSIGFFKQILIGYISGATNEYDSKYDGAKFDVVQMADLYSIIPDKKLIIQGRALPLDITDTVPLGYSSEIVGNYTIAIDHLDSSLINQEVYLEDKATNIIHNLNNGGYTFATNIGTFDNRFVLRYTNKTLQVDEFDSSKNLIMVAIANEKIDITAYDKIINKVLIYDMSGKLMYKKEAVKNSKLIIENLRSSNQVLMVKVILDNQHIETKKVIY
ncbi:T9SS sorting signal type C domain-containing protein [Flavobacterium sp. F-65]|uniref:T9SS sorting signal type C domain-containing protein n=1 Tax=Flavobacterium pisciphilum TaxID=2893755 RepID=A0ABS8MUX6_9FLAO|nr:T9SS sorting signal type C domain-containing protein [Flavobacterium sp. F-65]MCC9072595.1 T9SS sorting signal type C domain-containing protein [Flavobacterium sp. F-65]